MLSDPAAAAPGALVTCPCSALLEGCLVLFLCGHPLALLRDLPLGAAADEAPAAGESPPFSGMTAGTDKCRPLLLDLRGTGIAADTGPASAAESAATCAAAGRTLPEPLLTGGGSIDPEATGALIGEDPAWLFRFFLG